MPKKPTKLTKAKQAQIATAYKSWRRNADKIYALKNDLNKEQHTEAVQVSAPKRRVTPTALKRTRGKIAKLKRQIAATSKTARASQTKLTKMQATARKSVGKSPARPYSRQRDLLSGKRGWE